jgi:hypothetical protein
METWYVTLISWEADGLTIAKHTEHLSFDVSNENLGDFYILMINLAGAYRVSRD